MQTDHANLSTSLLKTPQSEIPFLSILREAPLILTQSSHLKISDIMNCNDELSIEIAGKESFIGLYDASHNGTSQIAPTSRLLNELNIQGFIPSFEEGDIFIERHKVRRGELGPDGLSPPFIQIQFYNFKSPVFARGRSMYGISLPANTKPELTILSGPCLYGTHGIKLINENQQEEEILNPYSQNSFTNIVDVNISDVLSLYELEFIQRIGKTISHIATNTNTKNIRLHVPCEEYFLYLLNRKLYGEIPESVKHKFINAVSARNEHLKSLLQEVIGIDVEFIQPLSCIKDLIQTLLHDTSKESDETYVKIFSQKLSEESEIFKVLQSLTPPQKLHDISNLSYLCGYIDAAQCSENNQRAALIVQNAPEEATFSNLVQRIKIQNHIPIRIAALFTHERIFLRGEFGKFTHPYFANFFSSDRENISEYIF